MAAFEDKMRKVATVVLSWQGGLCNLWSDLVYLKQSNYQKDKRKCKKNIVSGDKKFMNPCGDMVLMRAIEQKRGKSN